MFDLQNSATVFPVSTTAVASVDETGRVNAVSDTHRCVLREDTREIVGVVSNRYGLLTNESFLGAAEEAILESVPKSLHEGAYAREHCTGSWMRREYIFPEYAEKLRNTVHETKIGLRIVTMNSYDGSGSARIIAGLIDFYCTNGMLVGKGVEMGMRRHTSRISPSDLIAPLVKGIENATTMVDDLRKMIATPVANDDAIELLEASFSARRAAELFSRFGVEVSERGQNVFALHSALTHYASHEGNYSGRGDFTPRHFQGREDEVTRVIASDRFRRLLQAA